MGSPGFVSCKAQRIAHESPSLADLGAEQLERLARVVVAETLKDELRKAADLERVPYTEEREAFIQRAGRTGSVHTRTAYRSALDRLDAWSKLQKLSPLELTPARADDWIEALKAEGRAPSNINLDVAAASSFWTWMVRRHPELRNPFRGTRARPPRKERRKLEVPTDWEVRIIEQTADGWLRAAVVMMGQAGLRAGALLSLSINGTPWTATTKGKDQSGKLPQEAREASSRPDFPCAHPSRTGRPTRSKTCCALSPGSSTPRASFRRSTLRTTCATPSLSGSTRPRTTSTRSSRLSDMPTWPSPRLTCALSARRSEVLTSGALPAAAGAGHQEPARSLTRTSRPARRRPAPMRRREGSRSPRRTPRPRAARGVRGLHIRRPPDRSPEKGHM